MMLDQVVVRDAARAGPADTYGLIWMAEILLRISPWYLWRGAVPA